MTTTLDCYEATLDSDVNASMVTDESPFKEYVKHKVVSAVSGAGQLKLLPFRSVFSFDTNSQTIIRDFPYLADNFDQHGVSVNGALHWVCHYYAGAEYGYRRINVILSFDAKEEKFIEVPKPCNSIFSDDRIMEQMELLLTFMPLCKDNSEHNVGISTQLPATGDFLTLCVECLNPLSGHDNKIFVKNVDFLLIGPAN
ncbi:unnamed protein product [Dovyalis caffra]|uniref:F-box associated beta-propeller type 1 domain-containing protein n=1 Tax=Dovyalis caffra TaxID=77055 RepID=A0AAV1RY91_9ROSI|nr:unnamed protein product [Dovyalis caffra]